MEEQPILIINMNTLIIAQSTDSCNLSDKNKRAVYNLKVGGKKVYKTSAKRHVLRLRGRRVSNGPLFNNDSLTQEHATEVKVGLLYRGAERSYMVPVVWKKDYRGNYRRHITIADFVLLPAELQEVARVRGVDVTGKLITFSRCVAAWAGHSVQGMHVHHVNMNTKDDRLGNLWVMTPSEHAAVHSSKDDLVWDAEWYEFNSYSEAMLRLDIALLLTEEDIAKDLPPMDTYWFGPAVDQYFVDIPNDNYDAEDYSRPEPIPIASI